MSEPKRFGEHLYLNLTERSERSSPNGIEAKYGECVVPLDPFSLVCVARFRFPFTSEIAVLLRLAEAPFENTEQENSFKTGAWKEDVTNKVFSIAVLKTWLILSLPAPSSTKKKEIGAGWSVPSAWVS